jgi:hypothetical protein
MWPVFEDDGYSKADGYAVYLLAVGADSQQHLHQSDGPQPYTRQSIRYTDFALGKGALTGSPPCFLLVAWESYMTSSRTAMHFFIAIRIRVKI